MAELVRFGLLVAHRLMAAILHDDVVSTALDNRGGRDERQASLLLQLLDALSTAVAHRGLNLVERSVDALLERARVGNVGVDALLEGKLARATEVIALPVAGARGTLSPVLLHVLAVDVDTGGRALVKASKVAAEHHEVGAHGKRKRHVVVVDDTAIGAHGHVDAGLLEVFVTRAAHVDERRGLSHRRYRP